MTRRLDTTDPRNDECCVRHGCFWIARLRFEGEPLCVEHFGRTFALVVLNMQTQALIWARVNGYAEVAS